MKLILVILLAQSTGLRSVTTSLDLYPYYYLHLIYSITIIKKTSSLDRACPVTTLLRERRFKMKKVIPTPTHIQVFKTPHT